MPSVFSPPGTSRASKTTTSWPSLRSSWAQVSPAGPEPMTATRLPVGGPGVKNSQRPRRRRRRRRALQSADLHRRLQQRVIDAGAFAEHFGRAGPGAAAAEDVGVENGLARPRVAVQDLADELRDVDVRRAGAGAGGVEAVQAAGGLDERFVGSERRRHVGEGGRSGTCGLSHGPIVTIAVAGPLPIRRLAGQFGAVVEVAVVEVEDHGFVVVIEVQLHVPSDEGEQRG